MWYMLVMPVFFVPVLHGGKTSIYTQPVNIMLLLAVLHLYDEATAILIFTVKVEPHVLILFTDAKQLGRQVCDVGDDASVLGNEGIEKVDEDVLVSLGGKQPFEPEVGERINDLQVVLLDVFFGLFQAWETLFAFICCFRGLLQLRFL